MTLHNKRLFHKDSSDIDLSGLKGKSTVAQLEGLIPGYGAREAQRLKNVASVPVQNRITNWFPNYNDTSRSVGLGILSKSAPKGVAAFDQDTGMALFKDLAHIQKPTLAHEGGAHPRQYVGPGHRWPQLDYGSKEYLESVPEGIAYSHEAKVPFHQQTGSVVGPDSMKAFTDWMDAKAKTYEKTPVWIQSIRNLLSTPRGRDLFLQSNASKVPTPKMAGSKGNPSSYKPSSIDKVANQDRPEEAVIPGEANGSRLVPKELPHRHIFLTGLPGAGKTTYGNQLSKETGYPLISLDGVPGMDTTYDTTRHSKKLIKGLDEPSIVEGAQLMDFDPGYFKGKDLRVLNPGYDTVLKRILERGFQDLPGGKVISGEENSERAKRFLQQFMEAHSSILNSTSKLAAACLMTRQKVKEYEPTEAQASAGNYPKLHMHMHGFRVSIENPADSDRSGVAPDGTKWTSHMTCDYGYLCGTEAIDGDHVDVFLGPKAKTAKYVHIIDQVKPNGKFDEHKCMIGWDSIEEAKKAYLSNYEDGWQGLGAITTVSMDEFKKWVRSQDAKKPYSRHLVKEAGTNIARSIVG